jgi:predicted RNA-binding protein YlxR (DUF448 family)
MRFKSDSPVVIDESEKNKGRTIYLAIWQRSN